MCGIFGVVGKDAAMLTLEGLRKLEYRGYDSSGIAALIDSSNESEKVKTERSVGHVSSLAAKVNGKFGDSIVSIGHTRWATHGGVTEDNAHPHSSSDELMSVVHNGIIENTSDLLAELTQNEYKMASETDTELIIHLLHLEIGGSRDLETVFGAFKKVINRLKGAWAIAVLISGIEGIFIARNGAPLVIGRCDSCISVSSDPLSLYGACSELAYVDDGDVAFLSKDDMKYSSDSSELSFSPLVGDYSPEDPGTFPHMMIKEIFDQPSSFQNAISGRVSASGESAMLSGFNLEPDELKNLEKINLVACGTAFFAAELGARYIRTLSGLNVHAYLSSEFPAKSVCGENTLTIGVTQSGETKDTLDALTMAKIAGGQIASVCNVIGSTISRFTGNGAYLYAGPEYSVASTKAFTNMSAILLLLAMTLSDSGKINQRKITSDLREVPQRMSSFLYSDYDFDEIIDLLSKAKNVLFIGRGPSAHIADEGALKMMEITYVPCLSYPGGELKHGPIALIEQGTPVIAIAPEDSHFPKMEANIRECAARGAHVILISNKESSIEDFCTHVIRIPKINSLLSPFMSILPVHLLAYYLAVRLGRDVDRPRNLAKSVTVI